MSNNYTQFAEYLKLENADQREWLARELVPLEGRTDVHDVAAWCKERHIEEANAKFWPGFDYSFHDSGILIESQDYGAVENVANMAQMFLKKFKPDECFEFAWAECSDDSTIGAFGGGAVFVTAKKQTWFHTYQFLGQEAAKFNKKAAKKGKVKK